MSRYIAANGIASTDMFSQELDQSGLMAWFQVGMTAAENIPAVGDFAGLIGTLIEKIYEEVKTAQQENKVAVLNKIIQDHHIFPEDAELTIRRAGLLLAERKREEIEAAQAATASTLGRLGSKIENLKYKLLGTYQIAQSPQAGLAIEDVLALLVRMYKEYKTLNQPGEELYEQLAALVCTAVTQQDIAQAESALESEIRKEQDTIGKLKKKAGEGLWEAPASRKRILGSRVESKNCEEFFEEACVRRYIADSQPRVEISDQQVVAMRMVLFRHMCEGIREDNKQSLACAQKFAAKYPVLAKKIKKIAEDDDYPNYSVSQAILELLSQIQA